MTRFLLIRHATTDAVGKRLCGRMPGFHLNEQGRQQAENLAKRFTGLSVKAIYTSPLERAVETAEAIATILSIKATISNDFTELDFGDWTNCTIDEIINQPQFKRFNSFRSHSHIPNGEPMFQAQLRMVGGIDKLCRQHPNETIIIVSHSDMIKATIAFYAGIHLDMFQRLEISPASISTVDIYNDTAGIISINDTGKINV